MKKLQEKGMSKIMLKNNLLSIAFVLGLFMIVGVFAGNVIFQDGDFYVDDNINVQNDLIVEGNVGIGTSSPSTYGGNLVLAYSSPQLTLADNSVQAFVTLEQKSNSAYLIKDDGDSLIIGSKTDSSQTSITPQVTIGYNGYVGIKSTNPAYPLTVNGSVGSVSIWSEKNVSATGYITRTSVYDKSQGSALDKVKDASEYVKDGEIDHKAFYGYVSYDYDDCETDEETGEETCVTKTEEGVLLDSEVDVLRQAVYELKLQNQNLRDELCTKDTYSWC